MLIGAVIMAGSLNTPLVSQGITPEEAIALNTDFFVDENGNVYRRLGGIYVIMAETLVHQQLSQMGMREPLLYEEIAPPWILPQYVNDNMLDSQTNSALRKALADFYLNEMPYFDNPFPLDWTIPSLNYNDLRLSSDFSSHFLSAFRNDTFSQIFPFNDAYLAHLLNNVDFYFATSLYKWHWNGESFDFERYEYPYKGFYNQHNNIVFISAIREWSDIGGYQYVFYDKFAQISIHEIGHVLGLGESLAHLFEEMYMGLDTPVRLGSWERDSSFDRALLEMAGYKDFWAAAFTSNASYGRLWDMHFGHVVTFTDLQTIRALAHLMRVEGNLPEGYENIPHLFYQVFAPYTPDDKRPLYIEQVQIAMNNLSEIISQNNLQIVPIQAVFDHNIRK